LTTSLGKKHLRLAVESDNKVELDIDSEKLSAVYPYLSYECLHRLILDKIVKREFYIDKEELEECRDWRY
jgi:hypothetical protein